MSKNIYVTWLISLSGLLLFSFQHIPDGVIEVLGINCIQSAKTVNSPLQLVIENPIECIEESGQFFTLNKIKGTYEITKKNIRKKTWFNDDFYGWNNRYLAWLAIASINSSDFNILYADSKEGILVFSETINENYAIWVWKIDLSDSETSKPKELKLVDLIAGDEADKDFFKYLKQSGRYKDSRLPEIIQQWLSSKVSYCVTAILPNPCGEQDIELNPDNDIPSEEILTRFFTPVDTNKDMPQPQCISDITDSSGSTETFNFLVTKNNGSSYQVWRKAKTTAPIKHGLDWYTNFNPKSPLLAWLAIAILSKCETYEIPGTNAIISVCDTIISCYRDKDSKLDEYRPLSLLNKEDQKKLCEYLKLPTNYTASPLRRLIEDRWYQEGKKFKVISYFDTRTINGSDASIKEDLEINSISSTFPVEYFLVEEKDGSRRNYHIWSSGHVLEPSWYNTSVHRFKNPWIGKLALADSNVKVLEANIREGVFTFIVSKPTDYLWAWQFDGNFKEPKENAPFAEVYDKTPHKKELAIAYSKSIRDNPQLYDDYLQKNIRQNLKGTVSTIRQIYPKEVTITNDSPFGSMGEITSKRTSKILPSPLEKALINGEELVYLVEEKAVYNIYQNINKVSSNVWFGAVSYFADPWLAWLCLADPSIKVITKAQIGNPTRLCMVSEKNKGNLWSWVSPINHSANPPNQYQLVNGEKAFGLTNELMSSYIQGFYTYPDQTTDAEKQFFLEKADQPESFRLLDFLAFDIDFPNRILLWRQNLAETRSLLRVGLKDNFNKDDIQIHLVEKYPNSEFWVTIKDRYQKDWCRGKFKSYISRSVEPELSAWFGPNRLGLAKQNQVGVFLPDKCGTVDCRDFDYTNLNSIKEKVDDLIYIPRSEPNKETFFKSWVATKWDSTIWRANPLGYFDRVDF